jgi:hypothetical protein
VEPKFNYEAQLEYWLNELETLEAMAHNDHFHTIDIILT